MSILIIKSGTTAISGATVKGDFTYFSATTKGLGPTSVTGFWSGVDPNPICGGYTIYKIGGQHGWAAMVATGRTQLNEYLILFGAPNATLDENITWANGADNILIHSGLTGPCYYYTVYNVDEYCATTSSFVGVSDVNYSPLFNYYDMGATKYFLFPGSYSPTATLLDPLTLSSCFSGTTPTPTQTPTPTSTPSGFANITLFAKTSSTSGGPYYMWYSIDSGTTYTQFPTALTTTCTSVGTTTSEPVGTTFLFFMSDSNDPASSGGWPTNATSAGGVCPAITTLCTEGDITTTTSGTLTVWATGNQALPNAC